MIGWDPSKTVASLLAALFGGKAGLAPHVTPHPRRGRLYGHGSRKYAGPRDVAHRRQRIRLTRPLLKALNAAYHGGAR